MRQLLQSEQVAHAASEEAQVEHVLLAKQYELFVQVRQVLQSEQVAHAVSWETQVEQVLLMRQYEVVVQVRQVLQFAQVAQPKMLTEHVWQAPAERQKVSSMQSSQKRGSSQQLKQFCWVLRQQD